MEDAGFEPSLGGGPAGAELPLPAGAVGLEVELVVAEVVPVAVPVAVPAAPVETGVAATVVLAPAGVEPPLATTWKVPLVFVLPLSDSVNVK